MLGRKLRTLPQLPRASHVVRAHDRVDTQSDAHGADLDVFARTADADEAAAGPQDGEADVVAGRYGGEDGGCVDAVGAAGDLFEGGDEVRVGAGVEGVLDARGLGVGEDGVVNVDGDDVEVEGFGVAEGCVCATQSALRGVGFSLWV